eukprot:Rhum_TRINITY_DN14749_c7_g1::Rhum_TRINITY_DN14749_c7_g1_i1::g.116602::m.116602
MRAPAAALVLLGLASIAAALPTREIKAAGEKISAAVLKDMQQGIGLLKAVHTLAGSGAFHSGDGQVKGFPDVQQTIMRKMDEVFETEEGSGGVYAAYYADEQGVMSGAITVNNRFQAWVGGGPKNAAISCRDPRNRASCTAQGTGFLETWGLSDTTREKVSMEHNATYDPRLHEWYLPHAKESFAASRPYVFKPDGYASTIGITLSQAVYNRAGKFVGVAGVDIDLGGLDMILGPLRPAQGSEAVLADPIDGSIIVSTFSASRQIRWTHKKMGCMDQPFNMIFGHIINMVGSLKRASKVGPVLLHESESSKLLRWNSIYSHPIKIGQEINWLLVVTDDSENRAEAAGAVTASFALLCACLLCVIGLQ